MLNIRTRLVAQLVPAFFLSVVIGTLSHEAGHALGALRYSKQGSIRISYGSTGWREADSLGDTIYQYSERKDLSPDEQQHYEAIVRKFAYRELRAIVSGPLLTILLGVIGCMLLLFRKRSPVAQTLSPAEWISIFLALCWLRPVYLFLAWIITDLFGGRFRSDESNIAEILHCPQWVTIIPPALVGFLVVWYVTFWYIPRPVRNSFIAAAILGCPMGYFLWFYVAGPILLP